MFTEERVEHLTEIRDRILNLKTEYHSLYFEGLDLSAVENDIMFEKAQRIWPSGEGPSHAKNNDV